MALDPSQNIGHRGFWILLIWLSLNDYVLILHFNCKAALHCMIWIVQALFSSNVLCITHNVDWANRMNFQRHQALIVMKVNTIDNTTIWHIIDTWNSPLASIIFKSWMAEMWWEFLSDAPKTQWVLYKFSLNSFFHSHCTSFISGSLSADIYHFSM